MFKVELKTWHYLASKYMRYESQYDIFVYSLQLMLNCLNFTISKLVSHHIFEHVFQHFLLNH